MPVDIFFLGVNRLALSRRPNWEIFGVYSASKLGQLAAEVLVISFRIVSSGIDS